jgi:hypothetical protein
VLILHDGKYLFSYLMDFADPRGVNFTHSTSHCGVERERSKWRWRYCERRKWSLHLSSSGGNRAWETRLGSGEIVRFDVGRATLPG